MSTTHRLLAALATVTALATVPAGCGGDDTAGTTPAAASPSLSGVAATGAPLGNATVTVRCADGPALASTTSAEGAWSVQLDAASRLPCIVTAVGGSPPVTLHSLATSPGNVNVTPLTNLVVASAAGEEPGAWLSASSGNLPARLSALAARLDAAKAAVAGSLAAAGYVLPAGDFMTEPFRPAAGDPLDDLLEAVARGIQDNGGSYDAIVVQVAAAGPGVVDLPKSDVVTAAAVALQPRLNGGNVVVAGGVARLTTTAAANAVGAFVGGGTGNKAVLGLAGLAGLKLRDLAEIQLEVRPNTPLGPGAPQGVWPYVYINMVIDLDCGATTLPADATILDARRKRRLVIFDPYYKFIQQDAAISPTGFTTLTITPATGGWRVSPGEVAGDSDLGVEEIQQGVQYTLAGFDHASHPDTCIVDGVASADGGLFRDRAADPQCDTASALATSAPARCGKPHAGFLLVLGDSNTRAAANWDVRKVKVNNRVFTFE